MRIKNNSWGGVDIIKFDLISQYVCLILSESFVRIENKSCWGGVEAAAVPGIQNETAAGGYKIQNSNLYKI